MKITGSCHCGAIAYEAEVNSNAVRVCHCTDCQRLTGTAFRTTIPSLPGTFVLKRGFQDGMEGLAIAWMAAMYNFLKYAKARNMS